MKASKQEGHRCLICQGSVDNGALYMRGAWICTACEERLLRTTPEAPSYAVYRERLSQLWRRPLPSVPLPRS